MMKQKKTMIEKVAIGIIIFVMLMIVVTISFNIFVGVTLVNNPEIIGEWFSKLMSGFNKE